MFAFSPLVGAEETTLKQFSQSSKWKKLLHLKSDSEDKNGSYQSYVTSENFYLNTTNRKNKTFNLLSELDSTISAFFLPKQDLTTSKKTVHAQCLFPARLMLIKAELNLTSYGKLPKINCTDYENWHKSLSANSISIVFASGYMSNPASMYGHLFLKINSDLQNKSELLNNSLNYGAIVPNNENPIVYVISGIFGGYKAAFSDQQFYIHNHNYGEVELRDMWEYKLSISPQDTHFVTAHIWELLNNRFDYYFIDENCAYHIAKLLELVLEEPLIERDSMWVIPSSVAKKLNASTYNRQPLTKSITFLPSGESILHDIYRHLPDELRHHTQLVIDDHFDFNADHFQSLNAEQQAQVLEALFQYIHVIEQKGTDKLITKPIRRKLTLARLTLPKGKAIQSSIVTEKQAPHLGMQPSKLSSGVLHSPSSGEYILTGFRMTYFDDVSTSVGRTKFSNLEMIDIEFIANKDKLKLYRLDIVDIDSLYLPATPWTNDSAGAWSVRFGYEQINNSCLDCGVYFAEGDYGRSMLLSSDYLAYAMVGAKAFTGEDSDVHLSAKLGLIGELSSDIKMKLEAKQWQDIRFEDESWTTYRGEVNYHFAPNWEFRAYLDRNKETLAAIKLNYFWDF